MGLLVFFTIINGVGCGSFFSLFPLAVGSTFGAPNTMGILPILWEAWVFGYFLVRNSHEQNFHGKHLTACRGRPLQLGYTLWPAQEPT